MTKPATGAVAALALSDSAAPSAAHAAAAYNPARLHVQAFARAAGQMQGQAVGAQALAQYPRLAEEAFPPGVAEVDAASSTPPNPEIAVQQEAPPSVQWQLRGWEQAGPDGAPQVWLALEVQAHWPLQCQRCLHPLTQPLQVQQPFRFVADEATAEAEDAESEEDVLVLNRSFDVHALVEDELLMALPLVPRHEQCPVAVALEVEDASFEAANADKPHPFAALGSLRQTKPGT